MEEKEDFNIINNNYETHKKKYFFLSFINNTVDGFNCMSFCFESFEYKTNESSKLMAI